MPVTADKPITLTADQQEEARENREAFRKQTNLMGGAKIDTQGLFIDAKKRRQWEQFGHRYPCTSMAEWILMPTRAQDPAVREKIGEITLFTAQFTVEDTTASRMAFRQDIANLIRGLGYVLFNIDEAHGWDIPGESVVVGFHKPIPLYKPKAPETEQ